ncbi:MAG: hypothetical protein ACRDN6_11500 [Gaiellaceae bacterium]
MTALRPLALLIAAVVVGAAAGIAILRGREVETPPLAGPDARPMAVTTSVSPRVHVFGDPVVAEVDLLFDRRRVDSDTVRLDALFDPYEQVGQPERIESGAGDLVRLRLRYPLACLSTECVPADGKRQIELQSAQVIYRVANAPGRAIDPAQWPPFEVASRLGPFDLEQARWRADVRRASPVSYAVRPGVLGAALAGSALLLALGAAVLGFRLLPRSSAGAGDEREAVRVSSLERALAALAETSANGAPPEQRKALEGLARELGSAGLPVLAGRARRLAWSAERPSPSAVEELEGDIRDQAGEQL